MRQKGTNLLKGKGRIFVICVIFVLAAVAVVLPLTISTALADTCGEYEYTVNEDGMTATITGYTGTGGDITIPDTVTDDTNTYTVTAIADNAFAVKPAITSVMIPDGVVTIGASAFSGCTELRSAYFLGNAPSADDSIFSSCAAGFMLYYKSASTGFTNPWNGYTTAIFNPDITYTVTFDLNGSTGTALDTQTIYEGVKAACPADPSCNGQIFGGWYMDTTCENEWDFLLGTIHENTILYAKWTVDTLTVTFDPQGGSSVQSIEVENGSMVGRPEDPVRYGYWFDGWYKDADKTSRWCFSAYTVTSDLTLYAKWTMCGNAFSDLGFTPLDISLDPARDVIYMTAIDGYSLYRADLSTGEVSALCFDFKAERLAVANGKVYVTLPHQAHARYLDTEGTGTIAIVDTASFQTEFMFDVSIDPYDIEVDAAGYAYIAPGSSGWSYISAYDTGNGSFISNSGNVYYKSFIDYNPQLGKIYSTDQGLSPADIFAYEVTDGVITAKYDSPYHGTYGISPYIEVSPDGKYIFNGAGTVYTCASTESGDMIYDGNIGGAYSSISFDLDNNRFYTSSDNTLTAYEYSSRTKLYFYVSPDHFIDICHDGERIVAVQKKSSGEYCVNPVNTEGENACLSDISISAGALSPSFDDRTDSYSIVLSAQTSEVTITPVLSDSEASFMIDGESAESKTLAMGSGSAETIEITVTSRDGYAIKTYTVRVYRQSDKSFFKSDLDYIQPFDWTAIPGSPYIYVTGTNQCFVYRIDQYGQVTVMPTPGYARSLGYVDGQLLVMLEDMEFAVYKVGFIDPASFTLIDSFEVDACYTGLTGDLDNIYVYGYRDGIHVYSRETFQKTSFIGASSLYDLQVNSISGQLYAAVSSTTRSYTVTDGIITAGKSVWEHGQTLTIMPDGLHLILSTGVILSCSTEPAKDLLNVSQLNEIAYSACCDSASDVFYTSQGNTLTAYDFNKQSVLYTYTAGNNITSIYYCGSGIMSVRKDSSNIYDVAYINTESQDVRLTAVNVSTGVLSSPCDAEKTSYSLLLDSQTEEVTITPVMSDGEASLVIDGQAMESKTVVLDKGASSAIEITVTSYDGFASRSYTIHIYRQTDFGVFVTDADYIVPYDKVMSPDDAYIYMTGVDKTSVYRIDQDGQIQTLPMPGVAKSIGFADNMLLISLENQAFATYEVAIVNPASFTLTDIFKTDTEYTGFAGDTDYYYASNSSGVAAFSKQTLQKTASRTVERLCDMQYNKVTEKLYVTYYDGTMSLKMADGQFSVIRTNSAYKNKSFSIMPDGQHLVFHNGSILTCSTDAAQDLIYVSSLEILGSLAADNDCNELYIPYGRVIYVYDASDFSYLRAITEPAEISYVFAGSGYLFIAEKNSTDNTVKVHSVNTGALLNTLKIDGNAFSEFYQTHMDIDGGEVGYSVSAVEIIVEAAQDGAVISGDTGTQMLSVGENTLAITVTGPANNRTETYTFTIKRNESDPEPDTHNALTDLGFTPKDIAFDPGGEYMYMVKSSGYSLYRVNIVTGEIQEKVFGIQTSSITTANGKVYVALLRSNTGAGYGAVAVVDIATFKTEYIFDTYIYSYDIVADYNGYVYLTSDKYDQILSSYNSSNGRHIDNGDAQYYRSSIEFNTKLNKIYLMTLGLSPGDIYAFETTDGVLTERYDSPYHGDYQMWTNNGISPDGQYIFNGTGNVFTCAPEYTGDMVYDGSIGKTFTSICFNTDNNLFYTSSEDTLTTYSYDTRTELGSFISNDTFIRIYYNETKISALMKNGTGQYYITEYQPDLLLGSFTTDGVALAGFNSMVTSYEMTIPTNADTITIGASALDTDGRVSGDIGNQPLNLGENTYTVTVTSTVSGHTKNYTLHITRIVPGNVALLSLAVSAGMLEPVFDPDVLEYTLYVGENTGGVRLTPVTDDPEADFTMNSLVVSSRVYSVMNGGTVDAKIEVTAKDGITKRTYIVHITRALSTNAKLSSITANGGILQPAFNSNTTEYNFTLSSTTTQTTISVERSSSYAKVLIEGYCYYTWTVSLAPGETTDVHIEVTAQDGITRKTYIIHVTRANRNTADLVSINNSAGTLSPGFDRDVVEYDITLSNTTASTVITPTAEDLNAVVLIDGVEAASKTVTLGGEETCDVVIEVTSEDGTTQKTYTLHVSREPYSSNANLSGITLSTGALSPGFTADTIDYSVLLPNTVSYIKVTAVKAFSSAVMTIDGVIGTSKSLSLTGGVTKDMVIQVTAQDGITRKTYTLHITRTASNNTDLSGITLSTGSLFPGFAADIVEYSVMLSGAQSSIKITPVRSDSTASIKIGGISTSSTTITLMGGETKDVVIIVTAQDKVTMKEYTLHISREAIAVTEANINHSVIEMISGTSENLAISILPSDATSPGVSWCSNNTAIATVDQNGKVTAVSAGNATITATADGISDTCEVTVQPATYNIAAVSNNVAYGTASGGGNHSNGASVTLTAMPSAGYRFVCWKEGTKQVSTSAAYTCIANADRTSTAEFAPIGTPVPFAASAGYNSVNIYWPAVEGGAGYEVWRATSAAGTYTKLGTINVTTYTDTGLTTNNAYYYKVNAYCVASTATTYGSQSTYASATPVPSAPATYAAPTGYNSVYVSWDSVPGANGYELSRATSQNGIYSVVKTTSSLSYTNTSLGTGTTYYYRVRAYCSVGRAKVYGDYSPIAPATPVLSPVTSATASAYYPTSVKISWSSVPGRTKYEVWRSTSPDSRFALIKSTTSTSFKDTTLTPFVTYYYQIRVYRTVSGQKVYSASVSPTASATPILNNVTGVKAAMSSPSSNKVSWASVTGASGYEVWRSTSADSGYVLVKSTSGRSYTDNNLIPNTTYYYQVRAYRKVGTSPVPSAFCAPVSATPYFGSVTNPKAVRSSTTKIKLTWSAVSGRTGYEIYRSTSPNSGFVLLKSTTSTSFTDSNLTTGVTYYYKIVAYRTVNGVKCRSTESVVSATP